MDNKKLKKTIEKVLKADERIWNEEKTELNETKLIDLLEHIDKKIINLLLKEKELRKKFFVKIEDAYVFKTNDFQFFMEENKVNNSFTKYKNRIGLTDGKRYLKDTNDVVLDFPYKDCVLEGGQTTEEGKDTFFEWQEDKLKDKLDENGNKIKNGRRNVKEVDVPAHFEKKTSKRKEIFFNSVLAHDEIDRLFDPKALVNWKRYNQDGVSDMAKMISENNCFSGKEETPEIEDIDPLKGVRAVYGKKFGKHGFTFPINRNLTEKAKKMAKNMTKAEQIMWFKILKSKKTNFKWIKQKVIDNYIVDFYCHTLGLVIEIDGDSHKERKEYDKIRTELLNNFGLKVLRYSNKEVYNNLSSVKNRLYKEIQLRQEELQKLPLKRGQNAKHFGGLANNNSKHSDNLSKQNKHPISKRDKTGTIKEI